MARTIRKTYSDMAQVVQVGAPLHPLADLYFWLMACSWTQVNLLLGGLYVGANLLFAGLFLVGGDCIEGAEPGSFSDAFFFSVQTMSTIGYGHMSPKTPWADVLVTVAAMVALLGFALATGLMFARFSRPRAQIIFTRTAVVTRYQGKPALMFRVANARANDVVDTVARVALIKPEHTPEGHRMRRLHDLELVRTRTPVFFLSWMVIHVIDERSPLFGETPQSLRELGLRLVVTITGLDGIFSQTVYARRLYAADQIEWGRRFVDAVTPQEDGTLVVDYGRFHDTCPDPAWTVPAVPRGADQDQSSEGRTIRSTST